MPDVTGAEPVGATSHPRLLVIDADERTRESIVGILGIRHRYDVVGSAGHPGAALSLADSTHPDVVIVDPRLPDVHHGMALIRRLRSQHPEARILAVGWSPELEHDVLAAGATCFVRKTFKPGDLSGAISRCLDQEHTTAGEVPHSGESASPADQSPAATLPVPPPPSRAPVEPRHHPAPEHA